MSSVYALIAKQDLPLFEKGDIITYQDRGFDFGANIENNPKFMMVEVEGATIEQAEALVLPMTFNGGTEYEYEFKSRMLTVDIDSLTNFQKVSVDNFLSYISKKDLPSQDQLEDVIV